MDSETFTPPPSKTPVRVWQGIEHPISKKIHITQYVMYIRYIILYIILYIIYYSIYYSTFCWSRSLLVPPIQGHCNQTPRPSGSHTTIQLDFVGTFVPLNTPHIWPMVGDFWKPPPLRWPTHGLPDPREAIYGGGAYIMCNKKIQRSIAKNIQANGRGVIRRGVANVLVTGRSDGWFYFSNRWVG